MHKSGGTHGADRREGFPEATWATYERQREEFEPVDESFAGAHLVLGTGQGLSRCGHAAADWLRESEGSGVTSRAK